MNGIATDNPVVSENKKSALITGITGQDGSYLAELLLDQGYSVHGIIRRSSSPTIGRIKHLLEGIPGSIHLWDGDLSDSSSLNLIVASVKPDEVYNLGAQSDVKVSFELPEYTADVTGVGTVRLLEAIRRHAPAAKFYQASSSELYGLAHETPQSETTRFHPRSPYAAAKAYAFDITRNYRESYGMFAVNGILFNHESPRRGESFVTRKITRALGRILTGRQDKLALGNLNAQRDWGFAGDYVQAMWLMLQTETPEDYVIATGETHSVRKFCEIAFNYAGVPIIWQGEGVDEVGVSADGRTLIEINPHYFRPAEVDILKGDASKARKQLGWHPEVSFEQLIQLMVDHDRALAEQEPG